jgi:hypothetical protein
VTDRIPECGADVIIWDLLPKINTAICAEQNDRDIAFQCNLQTGHLKNCLWRNVKKRRQQMMNKTETN